MDTSKFAVRASAPASSSGQIRPAVPGLALCLSVALVLAGSSGCGAKGAAELLVSAQQRLDSDDVEGAAINAKNALQANPESAAARFMLAKALMASGDLSGAETELRRASEFGLAEHELLPALAALLLAQRNPTAVIERYKDTRFAGGRGSAQMRTQVARAYRDLGDADSAEAALTEALALVPAHSEALILRARVAASRGDDATMRRIAAQLLEQNPADAQVLLLQGDMLAQDAASLPLAAQAYRKALERRPRLAEAHANLISLLLTQNDLPGASAQAAAMAKALPNSAIAVFYQTLVAYMQNNFLAVRELSQRLLPGSGTSPQVLFLAGMAELRLGALAQAETLLARAVLAMPKGVEPRRELAGLYVRLARPAAALEALTPMLQDGALDHSSWRLAGQAHALAGDFVKADAAFARAAKMAPGDVRVRVEIGKSLLARGQIEPGLSELRTAAAEDATGTDADLALLSAHLRRNDTAAALAAVAALARKQPASAVPDLMRGRVLQRRGDVAGARSAFEQALGKDPAFFPALEGLAALELADKQPEAARQRYEVLLKRDPKSTAAMLALAELVRRSGGSPQKASDWVDKAVLVNPLDATVWLAAINFHHQAGDHVAALSRARNALTAVPDDPGLLALVAEAQVAAGDTQQAVSILKRLVLLRPELADGYNRLARAQLVLGNLAAAREQASKALELLPDWPPALRTLVAVAVRDKHPAAGSALVLGVQSRLPELALGWQLEGEFEAALANWGPAAAAFRQALVKGESSLIAVQLHQSLLQLGPAAEAADFAQRWLSQRPDDQLFVVHLGDTALARAQWQVAEGHYRKVLAAQPESPALLNNLAYVLLQKKDPGALAVAQRAVLAAPYVPEIIDTLAQAHAAANQIDKAIEWQAKAVELAPQTGRFRLLLARLYLKTGEKKKARDELQRLERQGASAAPPEVVQQLLQQAQG